KPETDHLSARAADGILAATQPDSCLAEEFEQVGAGDGTAGVGGGGRGGGGGGEGGKGRGVEGGSKAGAKGGARRGPGRSGPAKKADTSHCRKDSALKRWTLQLAARVGKRKAVVALARKLGVLLHRLWVMGSPHREVRAWGSLAQEVMDTGAAAVVAMRYNVLVVTAAQFVADLYAALARGQTLGEAVTLGRKQLRASPLRGDDPVALQDWPVPVVYEAAPLALFPQQKKRKGLTIT